MSCVRCLVVQVDPQFFATYIPLLENQAQTAEILSSYDSMSLSHFSPWVPLSYFTASKFGLLKSEALIITNLFVYPALEPIVVVLNLSVLTLSKFTFSNNFARCSVSALKLGFMAYEVHETSVFIVQWHHSKEIWPVLSSRILELLSWYDWLLL